MLFGKIVKTCGISPLIPNKDYLAEHDNDGKVVSNDENHSYKDQVEHLLTCEGGAGG